MPTPDPILCTYTVHCHELSSNFETDLQNIAETLGNQGIRTTVAELKAMNPGVSNLTTCHPLTVPCTTTQMQEEPKPASYAIPSSGRAGFKGGENPAPFPIEIIQVLKTIPTETPPKPRELSPYDGLCDCET